MIHFLKPVSEYHSVPQIVKQFEKQLQIIQALLKNVRLFNFNKKG